MITLDLTADYLSRPIRKPPRRQPDGTLKQGIRLWVPARSPRDLAKVDRIILHQWGKDVSMGAAGRRLVEGGMSPAEALAQRAKETPYHFQAGAIDGQGFAARVWPAELHTQHAGDQNGRSLGVGIFGLFPREDDAPLDARPGLALAAQKAIRMAAGTLASPRPLRPTEALLGRPGAPLNPASAFAQASPLLPSALPAPPLLVTHSQSTSKPADPGEWLIRFAVVPLVRAGVVRVEPEWSTGSGSPWPAAWTRWL